MQVFLTNEQRIVGLDYKQKEIIKDVLTFDNPAYQSAKRYGKSKYISIPKYLSYYKQVNNELFIPSGVNLEEILGESVDFVDNRISSQITYPKFKLELREEQKNAVGAYLSSQKEKFPKSVIQLKTGVGKSISALYIASFLRQKTLILVHKDDLVVSWSNDIKKCFGDIDIGLIKAKSRKIGEQITIATVQTLSRMSGDEKKKYFNEFGLVVQDETHKVGLNIFNIISEFNSKYKMGLSATPKREDGLDFVLNIFLGGICYFGSDKNSDICDVEVRILESGAKYKPFLYEGDVYNYFSFEARELPDKIDFVEDIPYTVRPTIPYLIINNFCVTAWETMKLILDKVREEYHKGRSCLLLFKQKSHIDLYYEELVKTVPERKLMKYYGDSKESSSIMMKKAESKEVMITLATYAKATEGTNVVSWEVLFLVSSLNNEKDVEQASGRIRRKKEGKINPVILYDITYPHCYSLRRHIDKRKKVYNRLGFHIIEKPKSMFTRGSLTRNISNDKMLIANTKRDSRKALIFKRGERK